MIPLLALAFYELLTLFERPPLDADAYLADKYRVWSASVAIGLLVLSIVGVAGVRQLGRLPEIGWARRRAWFGAAVGTYTLTAVLSGSFVLWVLTSVELALDDRDGHKWVLSLVIVWGFAMMTPWFCLVRAAHEEAFRTRSVSEEMVASTPSDEFDVALIDTDRSRHGTVQLCRIRTAIERAALALGLGVSTSVLVTGMLRINLIDAGLPPDRFPPLYVVGVGALFALVTVLVIGPPFFEWRAAATVLVDRVIGISQSGIPATSKIEARARLENHLGIDAAFLKRPITLLGILSPLMTGLISAVLPAAG